MILIITVFLLLFILVCITLSIRENPLLTEIKKRYSILKNHLREIGEFKGIYTTDSIITGTTIKGDKIGTNVNKGYEITLCLEGGLDNIDSVMNVFLHELAHQTVNEYEHSDEFWNNFKKLRDIASTLDIYRPIPNVKYCGQEIGDPI